MDAIERGKKPVVALLVLITSRPAILSLAAVQTKCDESFRVAAVAEVGVQSNYQRPGKHPGRRRSIPRRGRRSQGCHYDLLRLIGTLLPPLDPLSSLPASSSSSSSSMRRHTHNNNKKRQTWAAAAPTCYSLPFLCRPPSTAVVYTDMYTQMDRCITGPTRVRLARVCAASLYFFYKYIFCTQPSHFLRLLNPLCCSRINECFGQHLPLNSLTVSFSKLPFLFVSSSEQQPIASFRFACDFLYVVRTLLADEQKLRGAKTCIGLARVYCLLKGWQF